MYESYSLPGKGPLYSHWLVSVRVKGECLPMDVVSKTNNRPNDKIR